MNRFSYFIYRSDARWIVLLLLIALVFLTLFYLDYTKESEIGNRTTIGKIVYKNNQVQRKFADEVVWNNLRSNSPLTNMDLIRSENLSDAIIYLDNGMKIMIDENTMFFLDFSGGEIKLEFEGGSIQIEQGIGVKTGMTIKSGDTQIDVGDADLKIVDDGNTSKKNINLFVSSGNASIQNNGKSSAVGANQKASISDEGVSVKDVEVRLLKPAGQELIAMDSTGLLPFDFSTKSGYLPTQLEIAHDKLFTRVLKKVNPDEAKKGLQLETGTYYWRVNAKETNSGKQVQSETRRFRMIDNKPVKTFLPEADEKITYVEQKPSVTFSWESSNLASEYILEIAKDKNFSQDKKRYSTQINRLNVNDLENGEYYWRIITNSNVDGIAAKSTQPKKLSIKKTDSFDPPTTGRPGAGMIVFKEEFKDGVLFVWDSISELNRFNLEIANDKNFSSKAVAIQLNQNYYKLKKDLAAGTWYWRVQGVSALGKKSTFSSVASFIVDASARKPQEDTQKTGDLMKLLQPGGRVDMSIQNSLLFSWEKEAGVKVYQFTLYQIKAGKFIQIVTTRVAGDSYRINDLSLLDTGNFRWRLQAIRPDAKGTVLTRDFSIFLSKQKKLDPSDIEYLSPEVIYK